MEEQAVSAERGGAPPTSLSATAPGPGSRSDRTLRAPRLRLEGVSVRVPSLKASCLGGWSASLGDDGDGQAHSWGQRVASRLWGQRGGIEQELFWAESGVEFRTA